MRLIRLENYKIYNGTTSYAKYGAKILTLRTNWTWQLQQANNIIAISDVWFTEHEYPFLKSVRVVL